MLTSAMLYLPETTQKKNTKQYSFFPHWSFRGVSQKNRYLNNMIPNVFILILSVVESSA